jgi:hypothetical protein
MSERQVLLFTHHSLLITHYYFLSPVEAQAKFVVEGVDFGAAA